MGVSFLTYKDAHRLAVPADVENCPCCQADLFDLDGTFKVANAVDCADRLDGNEPGWYRGTCVEGGLRLSYGGYSVLREQISKLALKATPEKVWADPDAFEGQPFATLINYSDCEGAIGPETCAILAADFGKYDMAASDQFESGWLEAYRTLFLNFAEAAGGAGWVLLR